jgi:hypothetical protein
MSNLFEQASLIVTPNAVKAGKLYAIKPTSGAGDLDVVRATSATRVNNAGLIETVGNNVPRLDYTNASCPSILVEPQRTNFLLRSEEFDNASWGNSNSIVTPNSVVSPNGTITADTLSGNGTTGVTYLFQIPTVVSSTNYTISVFAKKNQTNFIQIFGSGGFGAAVFANFDLVNGVIGTTGTSNISTNIQNYGNGWYRCSLTALSTSTIGGVFIVPINSLTANRNPSFNNTNHSIFLWGAQLEAGSNATSYIPTVASAVTRNADVISKTGISSLIGQTEGTLYAEINFKNSSSKTEVNRIIELTDGTNANRIIIAFGNTNSLLTRVTTTSIEQASFSGAITTGINKIALAYSSSGVSFYINGVLIQSNLSATIPSTNRLNLGYQGVSVGSFLNDYINLAAIFPTLLTNAQLAQLTTL